MANQANLQAVDWSKIPAPVDDRAMAHLVGSMLPDVALAATDGETVTLAALAGRVVIYGYPMTGQPGVSLPDGWDRVPGARGCTPQSCAFRDHHVELVAAGVCHVYGISTQKTDYQREAAARLHLPFALLSDEGLAFADAAGLPLMMVEGMTLLKRFAMVIDDGRVTAVFYPVFPPDRNAGEVLAWLIDHPRIGA